MAQGSSRITETGEEAVSAGKVRRNADGAVYANPVPVWVMAIVALRIQAIPHIFARLIAGHCPVSKLITADDAGVLGPARLVSAPRLREHIVLEHSHVGLSLAKL